MNFRSAQQIWEAALGELQVQVSRPNFRTWLEKTSGIDFQGQEFVVGVPNAFVAEYLDQKQRSLIEKTLINIIQQPVTVVFRITGKPATPRRNQEISSKFNPRYTFDSFVAGTCNRMAYAAALSVAQNPGRSYNPLFIYGGTGLGKTHLLQAIGQNALISNLHVLLASAEQFTNEFVNAIKEKRTGEFQQRYRAVDMLLIDDIHFIVGKEQTEESFFHTFNELHNSNRQIVMTSDRPPQSLPLLEERLSSRFQWGLTIDVQPPDFATRLAIVQAKAKQETLDMPASVLELIAAEDFKNVRQLEGALNRVTAYSQLVQAPPTPLLAAQALGNIAAKKAVPVTPEMIIQIVASNFKLTPDDLKGKGRDKQITLARHLAMYLMRKETPYSLAQIGQEMGGRDHSTVIHACELIKAGMESIPFIRRKLTDIQDAMNQDRPA